MRWVLGLVLTGCSFHSNGAVDASGGSDDSPLEHDAPVASDGCLGTGNFKVCPPPPTMAQVFGAGATNDSIDTDGPNTCAFVVPPNGGPSFCVIAGTSISIGPKTLFITGSHPAVLFATGAITISGGVDVGSHYNGPPLGGGANASACGSPTPAGSGAGGAGGTFTQVAGNGGNGAGNGGQAVQVTQASSDFLRGGCRGGDGGDGGPGSGGGGNNGGGAILLLAGAEIGITGYVSASGGGGSPGGSSKGGGGGGGSGGMIALAAPAIDVTGAGHLIANGGGGGGGGDGGQSGSPGSDPDPGQADATQARALGGAPAGGAAGAGASGGTAAFQPATAANAGDGAGGGGGGDGLIRVLSGQVIGGQSSPAPVD